MKFTHDSRNTTLALLTITACLLGTVVLLVQTNHSAVAAGSESRAGDYILCPGAISTGTDLVYVIDIASQKLNAYGANINTRTVELVPGCAVDLRLVFESEPTGN